MKRRIAQLLIRAARRLDPPKGPTYNVTSVSASEMQPRLATWPPVVAAMARLDAERRNANAFAASVIVEEERLAAARRSSEARAAGGTQR